MNLLYVTTWDSAGQNFNGYLLKKALAERGHDVHMAVYQSLYEDPNIHELSGPILSRLNRFLSRAERFMGLHSVLPVTSLQLYDQPYYQNADVVHLQLLHASQFLSMFNLPVMSRQHPTVYTLHDPWMTTGHCIHSLDCDRWLTGCGQCPDLDLPIKVRRDATALAWKIKKWVMHNSNINLVVASQWMWDRLEQSPILSHLPRHLIPFGVDTTVFRPRDQAECRRHFSIPPDAHVLAFRAVSPSYKLKGTEYVQKALEMYEPDRPTFLLTFEGRGELEFPKDKYITIELGWVTDPDVMVHALGAADLFLMPSLAESFGLMTVESMACGTPVIAFDSTSLPAVLHAPEGGVVVPARDHAALLHAIEDLLGDEGKRRTLTKNGLEIVQREYTLDLYVKRHLELYQSLLQDNGE